MSSSSVVIIGAGPGGGAAAVALAQCGVRDVVLLDKDHFPRDKTCGSGLSPNALGLLASLGVGDEVRRLGDPINAVRLVTPGGREIHLGSDETSAIVLLRKHLDDLLMERARGLGVDFRPGFHARELLREGGRVVGVRDHDGHEVRARWVLAADGAHSIFSVDPRPKRTISTLMGWWEGVPFEPHAVEMIFDPNLAPLYGWLFPESAERVNIGICMDGEDVRGGKTARDVRAVFQRFLDDHYASRLRGGRQIGRLKGHPISHTTWIAHTHGPGVVYLGEAARITHNATGEGIYQAMQSGVYAAEAVAAALSGASEAEAMRQYTWRCRRRFTASFLVGHAVRAGADSAARRRRRALRQPLRAWRARHGVRVGAGGISADQSWGRRGGRARRPSPRPHRDAERGTLIRAGRSSSASRARTSERERAARPAQGVHRAVTTPRHDVTPPAAAGRSAAYGAC